MTVRFKCQSEYQKSYKASRSRSVSPQRCAPFAGLRSDQMGISSEPGLQRRKKFLPVGPAQSCSSLLCPSDQHHTLTETISQAHRTPPPDAPRSSSAQRKASPLVTKSPAPPVSQADTEPPPGPRPAADPEPPAEPRAAEKKLVKPQPCRPDSQPHSTSPLTAPDQQCPSASEEHALRWRAGMRSGGQRSRSQRTEYHRQFSWKKPTTVTSPVLTAEQQLLYSSSRAVPPFKKNPVSMETEYQRSFQGQVPRTGPCLRKHFEHERIPLFHMYMSNRKKRESLENKTHPKHEIPDLQNKDIRSHSPLKASPPIPASPPQVQRRHRMLTEYESSFRSPLYRIPEEGGAMDGGTPQVKELRQQALLYRRRAWGTNFSRDHLSQLQSQHNTLWEPTDTTDSATDPPTPHQSSGQGSVADPHSCSPPCVEALDLASHSSISSHRTSVLRSGDGRLHQTNKNTQTNVQKSPSLPPEGLLAGDEEEETDEEEEGRLPTPRLKILPVQRTHHDLTTPATGGAILVGKLKSTDESSANKQQRCGTAVSIATGAEIAGDRPITVKEAWPENNISHLPSTGPAPNHKPSSSPPCKSIRMKQTPLSPVAPPPAVPLHCIQGTLRHADFQHNGQLGLRFKELQSSRGGCGSDEDDRLSVMSWRSAASCSMASAVLERAQKRRENFWGKS